MVTGVFSVNQYLDLPKNNPSWWAANRKWFVWGGSVVAVGIVSLLAAPHIRRSLKAGK